MRGLADMEELERLKARLLELGMSVWVWDASGAPVGECGSGSEFCRLMQRGGYSCADLAGALARRVIAADAPAVSESGGPCCHIGAPIHQRRRLLGAVVVGYPIQKDRSTLEETALRVGIDAGALGEAMARAARPLDEAPRTQKMLTWMLEQEQAVEGASGEIASLSANLAATYEELSLVYRISAAMKLTQRPREFLQNVCDELGEVMNITAAAAVVHAAHSSAGDDDEVVVSGQVDLNAEQIKLLAASQIAPRLAVGDRTVLDNQFRAPPGSGLGKAIRTLAAVPMMADKAQIGMLIGLNKKTGEFLRGDLKLLGSIASQAAAFVVNNRLYADLQDLLMGVLHALTSSIDAKDPYTCGHSQRVAIISKRLAEAWGFGPQKVQQVYLMGLLHDIGKIGVPEAVLCKPGRLTDAEFELIKNHPVIGAKILGGIRQLEDAIGGILTHHERLDGTGYPRKLKGDELPFEGLIVGLADGFDAMTSDRTYRKALPLPVVVAEIRKNAGAQFHPGLVDKFLAMDLEKFLAEIRQPGKAVLPLVANLATASDGGVASGQPGNAIVEGVK